VAQPANEESAGPALASDRLDEAAHHEAADLVAAHPESVSKDVDLFVAERLVFPAPWDQMGQALALDRKDDTVRQESADSTANFPPAQDHHPQPLQTESSKETLE